MSKRKSSHSPWSLRIATVAGIPIRLHFTFLLFLLFLYLVTQDERARISFWIVPAIFLCVLLHELGHALTARKYGIETRDITLYPIGGIAMFQGRRPRPKEEFWIALAGPAVNVVIALILLPILILQEGGLPPLTISLQDKTLLQGVFVANIILPIFNMIPAFPMDGGRVLRAVLAMRMPEHQATQIAGAIGQFLAIAVGFLALLMGNIFLMLIAFFVFIGAGQEVAASVSLSFITGRKIRDAMITQFSTLSSNETLDEAGKMLLQGTQQDFPITFGDEVLGVLSRSEIAQGLTEVGPEAYVSGHMSREFKRVTPDEPLERALELMTTGDAGPLLVMEHDELLGMITRENLSEFIMLEHAKAQSRTP